MEIVVNTRLLLKNKLEGIGWFSYETLKRITQQHPEDHFIFVFDRDFDESFIFSDNITPVVFFPQARHPILYYWWFEFSLGKFLNKAKPDVFLSPDGYLSLAANVPSLPVIHDLNFEYYPQDLPFSFRKYYQHFFPLFAKKAARIATVSEYSKQDISKLYSISPDKIDVVYDGVNTLFSPISEIEKIAVKQKYSQSCDYFLFVGSLHPRKNITRLLQAFDAFKKAATSAIKLVIVGEKYWWTSEMEAAYEKMNFKNEVVFVGRMNAEQLYQITAAAFAITYVPYFEGFGIPLLEAMKCDVPVITSNVTSMPEIAADAALLVDPFSVESIKDGMLKISQDEQFRKMLIEKGRIRSAHFSWDKTASLLWNSIEKTVSENPYAGKIL
ncbi:MAG: glycosyltransferase family 1 protein [Bacteroidia bacterium]